MKRGKQVDQDETDYLLSSPKNAQRLMTAIAQLENKERTRLTLEGLVDIDAGRVIAHAAVKAWADSLNSEKPLPLPTREDR